MNVADERKRLATMVALTSVGFVIAGSGLMAAAALRAGWGWPMLVAGVVIGVGAQIVFIVGVVRRAGKV